MQFPQTTSHGDAQHADAIKKRTDAREGHRRLSGLAAAAVGTPVESQAADLRDAAKARLHASEAWLAYIEDDALTPWPGSAAAAGEDEHAGPSRLS